MSLHVADVTEVLLGNAAAPTGPWDAVLLDTDNSPDFLIHDANDRLYPAAALHTEYGHLTPSGVLAVWCQGPAPDLLRRMQAIAPPRSTATAWSVRAAASPT